MSWVFIRMRDITFYLFRVHRSITMNDITGDGKSPGCGIMTEKSTERASIRGGVPVLNVPLVILIHVNAEQVQ